MKNILKFIMLLTIAFTSAGNAFAYTTRLKKRTEDVNKNYDSSKQNSKKSSENISPWRYEK